MGRPPKLSRYHDADGSGDGEGGGNNYTGPLLSWSSGNRQHPWNLKRRASTNFVLPMPAIEESTYRLVLQHIQNRKRRQFNSKKRRYEHIQQAEQRVKVAEQQVEVAASKVKAAREKLNDVKKLRDQARDSLQRSIQQKHKESAATLETQIQKLEQEIRSVKEPQEEEKMPAVTDISKKLHLKEAPKQSDAVKDEGAKNDARGENPDDEKASTGEQIDSAEVEKESVEKIMSDISELNQTKSQLIWLLKQVITAENIRKEEAKKIAAMNESVKSMS